MPTYELLFHDDFFTDEQISVIISEITGTCFPFDCSVGEFPFSSFCSGTTSSTVRSFAAVIAPGGPVAKFEVVVLIELLVEIFFRINIVLVKPGLEMATFDMEGGSWIAKILVGIFTGQSFEEITGVLCVT